MTKINTTELIRLVDSIARDRNIDKESLYTDIEQAMVSAARKHFNAEESDEFICELDRITGKLTLTHNGEEIPLEELGRIPAQTAKQVMIQRFREDERASIFGEFEDRQGELITGTAQRYEGSALIVQVGRAEGFMPRSEQIPGEQHQPGERVRCMILDVRDAGNQVKIVLTRAHPDFIRRLFEVEVPEVTERIIEIKAMAREAGHRTKVAVGSIDSKVDPVGACVGVRGSRIKNIVDELAGEKIDIVRWNESSQILIQNALKPAEVVEISLCFELGRATVVVNEDQLSLAIGKRGQNVRLAARLTGWDVDILTPPEFTKSLDTMEETLREIEGVTDEQLDRLGALGVISVFDVEEVGPEYLIDQIGIEEPIAEKMVEVAAEKAKVVAEEQQKAREAKEAAKAQEQQLLASDSGALDDILGGGALAEAGADSDEGGKGETSEGGGDTGEAAADAILGGSAPAPPTPAPHAPEADALQDGEDAVSSDPETIEDTLSAQEGDAGSALADETPAELGTAAGDPPGDAGETPASSDAEAPDHAVEASSPPEGGDVAEEASGQTEQESERTDG